MSSRNCAVGILCSTVMLTASASCVPAVFETSLDNNTISSGSDQAWLELSVAPTAVLELPTTVSKIGLSPAGSLVFRSAGGLISGGVSYETSDTVGIHESGAQPAPFFSAIFRGEHDAACLYSQSLRLSEQDYRIHLTVDAGEIFAFGKGDSHHFFLLSQARPDLVINGALQGVEEGLFRLFLSKIQIK